MSKKNIKIYIRFATILILCYAGGYLIGKGGVDLQEDIKTMTGV